MPTAICKQCGKLLGYTNRRGFRLGGYLCTCGGRFAAAAFNHDTKRYEIKGGAAAKQGKIVKCAACGKRRREDGPNVRRTEMPCRYIFRPELGVLPAGSVVCWSHSTQYDLTPASGELIAES